MQHAMIRRRTVLATSAAALVGLPTAAWPQAPARVARVAYVWMFGSGPSAPYPDAFRARLREIGWQEGRDIEVAFHDARGSPDELARIMEAVVRSKVDVILAVCTPEARAARRATTTIPIVMAAKGDPVAAGLVASLARPGGNVTGVSTLSLSLSAKRVALLKEAFPRLVQATVLWNPDRPDNVPEVQAMRDAATRLGLRTRSAVVRTREELAREIDAIGWDGTQAVLNAGDSLVTAQARDIVARCAQLKLPAMYEDRIFVDAGGLMSYGPDLRRMHGRAADYVDRILKGARPEELPIEQPTRFELVLNLRAAAAMGATVPPAILLQADDTLR